MNLRVKLAIAMVALAAGATITVGSVTYFSTSRELRSEVDLSLTDATRQFSKPQGTTAAGAAATAGRRDGDGPPIVSPDGDGDDIPREFTLILVQVIDETGTVVRSPHTGALPVREIDKAVAAGTAAPLVWSEATYDREDFRVLTVHVAGGALILARSLAETESVLDSIRNRTLLTVGAMALLALLLGWLIAQQITRRLVRLTRVATGVATSGSLDVDVPVDGSDETGQLGKAFSDMLSSLARAKKAQYELVQDAGHELRTPLTSLRTNVSVMRRFDELSPRSRQQLLDDVESETRELTDLVNELVELATERRDEEPLTTVTMADTARHVVERARRRSGRVITLEADETAVEVRAQALERAMTNLVGNAVKFSEGDIEVRIHRGRFEVLDRGPGVTEDDLPRIFDRFHRSITSRSLPGSGLGLSIVREMAETHGGVVHATNRPGGGAVIGFSLPPAVG
jgi:two-component system sensor histidine kinase MprB